ncbi:hypothetical protein AAG570_013512 [Ranatra chinensis]|uniref:Uncharacterized protein n=1 Tax=Ranatra chinensis TaxID=642074 RepID=A0ABD0YYR7_9HEMI
MHPSRAGRKNEGKQGQPVSRAGACRVCLKCFKPDDYSNTCGECQQKVCEDCASYSKRDENEDELSLRVRSDSSVYVQSKVDMVSGRDRNLVNLNRWARLTPESRLS